MPLTPDERKQMDDLHQKIQKCLNDAGGNESDIGVQDMYWTWLNQYRGLLAKSKVA